MTGLKWSIFICIASLFVLLWILRRDRISLGLPFAYLAGLLLIHVPGGLAHMLGAAYIFDDDVVAVGVRYTAIGAVSFVVGVRLARSMIRRLPAKRGASRPDFWVFCVLGGWFVTYALSPLANVPSLGALIDRSTAIWMLGVMLGLRAAVPRRELTKIAIWTGALFVYPVLMLLFGGFLSYGATAVMIVASVLAISTRGTTRVVIGVCVAGILGLSLFSSYYQNRDRIRGVIWSDASIGARTEVARVIFSDFRLINLTDRMALAAFDQRLNQNYFVGLAAQRIKDGDVRYLYGRSIYEAAIAVIPRALWPGKPVFGGSGNVVSEMTGLRLSRNTSWGVGNVMEFQINFGTAGVVMGFLLLGAALGALDMRAAIAEARGDMATLIYCFLPAVALIQPNGSMVELGGGVAAAVVAAFAWNWIWRYRERHRPLRAPIGMESSGSYR